MLDQQKYLNFLKHHQNLKYLKYQLLQKYLK